MNERVHFRILNMGCCNFIACWVNSRLPSYCPECGKRIYPEVRSWVTDEDTNAHLKHSVKT
jgi:hypothetical protein